MRSSAFITLILFSSNALYAQDFNELIKLAENAYTDRVASLINQVLA
jgi:hypothetical protein